MKHLTTYRLFESKDDEDSLYTLFNITNNQIIDIFQDLLDSVSELKIRIESREKSDEIGPFHEIDHFIVFIERDKIFDDTGFYDFIDSIDYKLNMYDLEIFYTTPLASRSIGNNFFIKRIKDKSKIYKKYPEIKQNNKNYNYFHSIDEKWNKRDTRYLLNTPRWIVGFVQKIVGLYPLLNFKWDEIKKRTVDRSYDPLAASGANTIPNKIESDLVEINKDSIPSSKVKRSIGSNKWRLYTPLNSIEKGKRKIIYVTKDELKTGDYYYYERLSDTYIYPEDSHVKFKGVPYSAKDEYPIIVLVAKFGQSDKVKSIEKTIDDICTEIKQDFGVDVKPHFDLFQKYLSIDIESESGIKWEIDEFGKSLDEISDRILGLLESEGYSGFKYEYSFYLKEPSYYKGHLSVSRDSYTEINHMPLKWNDLCVINSDLKNAENKRHVKSTNILISEVKIIFKKY